IHGDHFHCPKPGEDEHDHEETAGPWVDLESHRYDLRTELNNPFAGVEKLRAHASFTDYEHDELEESEVISNFKSKGYDSRLELVHEQVSSWKGVVGAQNSQQKIRLDGRAEEHNNHSHSSVLMADTKTEKCSLFGIKHKQIGDVHVERGARVEYQEV